MTDGVPCWHLALTGKCLWHIHSFGLVCSVHERLVSTPSVSFGVAFQSVLPMPHHKGRNVSPSTEYLYEGARLASTAQRLDSQTHLAMTVKAELNFSKGAHKRLYKPKTHTQMSVMSTCMSQTLAWGTDVQRRTSNRVVKVMKPGGGIEMERKWKRTLEEDGAATWAAKVEVNLKISLFPIRKNTNVTFILLLQQIEVC